MTEKRTHRPLLYFVPGVKHVPSEMYDKLGLEHLHGTSAACRSTSGPPESGGGCVLLPNVQGRTMLERLVLKDRGPGPSEKHLHCDPDIQTWKKCNGGAYWVGWKTGAQPEPVDLIRLKPLGGEECEMGDGNRWVLPKASLVPLSYCLNGNGDFGGQTDPKFEAFERAALVLEAFCLGTSIKKQELVEHVVLALGVNYRLGLNEALALGLINDDSAQEAAAIIVELDKIVEVGQDAVAEKKTDG